MHVQDKHATIW